jgi:MSHA biogenesis protein MshI
LAFFKKRSSNQSRQVALHLSKEGVAIACAERLPEGLTITHQAFVAAANPLTSPDPVIDYLNNASLTDSKAGMVLNRGEYQLLLVEAPEVPENELKEALIWRVKDFMNCAPEAAYIDYCPLPEDAYRGRGNRVYVAVVERELVEARAKWMESLGLEPAWIDIPELSLLNLVESITEDEMGTAVLALESDHSHLLMCSGSQLYMTRDLPYNPQTQIDSTVLDVQRSMDYFESQIGKPPCVRILVLPLQVGETPLMMALREGLGADVQSLDLADVITASEPLRVDLQQRCLYAIAAALRPEGV